MSHSFFPGHCCHLIHSKLIPESQFQPKVRPDPYELHYNATITTKPTTTKASTLFLRNPRVGAALFEVNVEVAEFVPAT